MQINNDHNTAVKVQKLFFNYNSNQVLEDVSFEIKAGDYVGIIGPNGGGKTTLLRLITGLLQSQNGHIEVFGRDPKKARIHGKIGYVPQRLVQSNIQCPATVEEIVTSGRVAKLGIGRKLKNIDKQAIQAAMKDADIEKFSERSVESLSGGERQRVFIARALASEPTILILDEPTTGLHFADVKRLIYVLNQLVEKGNTVVVIEHNLDMIKTADWLIDMGPEGGNKGGQIVAFGTPEDVVKIKASYTGQYLKKLLK